MIIKDLSKYVIIDDIRINAKASDVHFISHLLGNERLNILKNWPSKIYTSQFIANILMKMEPVGIKHQYFKILQVNNPTNFKTKDKTFKVTMFETEEITKSVIFFFDDSISTFLYTGVLTEISNLNRNEHFLECIQNGIDNVYIDGTRCNSKSLIFADIVAQEINKIYISYPGMKLAVILPDFGYEKLLVELIKQFPQRVYPQRNQVKILEKLGYQNLLAKNPDAINIISPGQSLDFFKSKNILAVYITEGSGPTDDEENGIFTREWSPHPSCKDLIALLELIKPKSSINSIKHHPLDTNVPLPSCFKFYIQKRSQEEVEHILVNGKSSKFNEICSEEDSKSISETISAINSFSCGFQNRSIEKVPTSPKKDSTKQPQKENLVARNIETIQLTNEPTKSRTRVIRHRSELEFQDSDDDMV